MFIYNKDSMSLLVFIPVIKRFDCNHFVVNNKTESNFYQTIQIT